MTTTPTNSTELGLVNWPTDDDRYQGSGEGGLFAYAVWFLEELYYSGAGPVLDSFPQFKSVDVVTGVHGADAERFRDAQEELRKIPYNSNFETHEFEKGLVAPRTPVVVFLGATDSSLYSENYGQYFSVQSDDLTDKGLDLMTALEAVYGPATYLTFLDT